MKKLMTLLSAAAVAFGLQAADTGTSFEGMSAGDLDITSTTGELSGGPGYWVTKGNEKVSLTVTAGTSLDRNDLMTITQYKAADQERYLRINSPFGNPVTRKINTDNSVQLIGDDGFYFDSLVKFTAFDEDPMTTAVANDFDDAKIAVWIQEVSENEVVTGTNLYVRAGYLGGQPQTYDCGELLNAGDWQRLTIKAIKNIYKPSNAAPVPAFVVFINGESVGTGYNEDKGIVVANLNDKYLKFTTNGAIFPSLAQTGEDSDRSLSSVSFDGQGDVDDIVFTERVPNFAKDSQYAYVYWDPKDVVGLTIGETTLTYDAVTNGNYKISFANSETTVTITPTYAEGKLAGTWTGNASIDDTTVTFTSGQTCRIVAAAAAASFNGTSYATLAEAIDAAEDYTGSANPVLKLFGATASDDIAITLDEDCDCITIDLNGCKVGGIDVAGTVWIVDSIGTGVVNGDVALGENSRINAGTYEGDVTGLGAGSLFAVGVRINAVNNDPADLEDFEPDGYEFVADGDYLVLVPATPKFDFAVTAGDNSYVSNVSIDNVDVTTGVTNGTITVIASNVAWSVTFTANSGYEFEGGLTTTNFTGTAEAAVDLTGPDAAAQQGGGWVDPEKIPENTEAGDQYSELAESELAETDAKKLTEWADTYTVGIADVAAAAPNSVIYDAYLLGCEPTAAAVAEAKADFVPSIAIVDGEVVVTEPDGDYNGRLIKKGSANLEDWYDANTNEGYNFFKYELVP